MLIQKRTQANALGVPRLGELFVEAGILRHETVTECLAVSKRAQMPIGRILVMSGYVSERDVESALHSQQLVVSGHATREAASRLVRIVHCNKMSIDEARALEVYEKAFTMPFSQLGRMLLAAQILTEKHLMEATQKSNHEQMPLGRYLVKHGAISSDFLVAAMNCLILVRDRKITRYEAVQILSATHLNRRTDLRDTLVDMDFAHLVESNAPRLLDLLRTSQLLSDADANWVLEMSVESGRQTGQVLIFSGLINDTLLESTLQLQKMLANRTLNLSRAAELLKLCKELNAPLESILAEFDKLNQVIQFLRAGRVFSEAMLREVAAETPDFDDNAGAIMLRKGIVTPEMLNKGARCLGYFRNATLTEQQAVDTFKYSMQMKVTPEEAMRYINWDLHNRHGNGELLGKSA